MTKPKIVVVIPTIRETQYRSFITAWEQLFKQHEVVLVTVWDGETPTIDTWDYSKNQSVIGNESIDYNQTTYQTYKGLIYRYTDACRNLGFIVAAHLNPDYILTLDDDVSPNVLINDCNTLVPWDKLTEYDPIQQHLDVLQKRVCLGWINTAHDTSLYLRGVPYNIRNEAQVMLSHGVWVGTPDFDGETQLSLEKEGDIPYSLPYYIGPIPKGVLFPCCGMNLMVKREALPYLYFAPMGIDTGIIEKCKFCNGDGWEGLSVRECIECMGKPTKSLLNRFSDIWMGISLKREFDRLGWACYTGSSTILHTRASDAQKNFEQEKLGREWNEYITNYKGWDSKLPEGFHTYMATYRNKREKFKEIIENILIRV